MAKEGKNNFELKKGKRFQFDLSKNPKRTFDLVKDVDEAPALAGPVPPPADTYSTTSHPTTKPQAPIATVAQGAQKTDNTFVQGKPQSQLNTQKDTVKPSKQSTKQPNAQNNTIKKPGPSVPKQQVATSIQESSEEPENAGGNKWMWIVGAILVFAIIAWLCVRGCSSSNDNGATTEPAVEVVEMTGTSDEEAVAEQSSSEEVAEQPAVSETETERPAVEEATSAYAPVSTATPSETPASAPTATSAPTPARETASIPSANAASASAPAAEVSSDIEAEAMKVIRGDYGTGLERKLKLGSKYREIQNRVNELKRQGAF